MKTIGIADLPNHLYKYRSCSDETQKANLRSIIIDHELYWASPIRFNDPFDCAPTHRVQGSRLKRQSEIRKIFRKHMPHASRAERRKEEAKAMARSPSDIESVMDAGQRQLMAKTGVCSLSTNPDSVLMWSHYSGSHRGVCLRFSLLSKDGRSEISESLLHFEFALPVSYSRERPIIDIFDLDRETLLELTLLRKADFWSYEKEWRLIDRTGPGLRQFPYQCLTGIIFGVATPDADRKLVSQWAKESRSKIELLQAKIDPDNFRLNFFQAD